MLPLSLLPSLRPSAERSYLRRAELPPGTSVVCVTHPHRSSSYLGRAGSTILHGANSSTSWDPDTLQPGLLKAFWAAPNNLQVRLPSPTLLLFLLLLCWSFPSMLVGWHVAPSEGRSSEAPSSKPRLRPARLGAGRIWSCHQDQRERTANNKRKTRGKKKKTAKNGENSTTDWKIHCGL